MRLKRVLAEQLEDNMQAAKLTKAVMARKIATSPSQLSRALDASKVSAQLDTLIKAARALAGRLGLRRQSFMRKRPSSTRHLRHGARAIRTFRQPN